MQQYRIKRPPKAIRRPGVRLDNVALVPASLLPFKKAWQVVANGMPTALPALDIPFAFRQAEPCQPHAPLRLTRGLQ
jgi:hypothetical protein